MPRLGGSFRDPAGFVFTAYGTLYRQVNRGFADEVDACPSEGLCDALIGERLLVPHQRVDLSLALTPEAHAMIAPDVVPFVSRPYEWCFGELRDAALLTTGVQLRALEDIAAFVAQPGRTLVVEFVAKADSQALYLMTRQEAPSA